MVINQHECSKETLLTELIRDVNYLLKSEEKDVAWKDKMEDKLDKILWFMLGQTFTLVIGVIVGITVFLVTT